VAVQGLVCWLAARHLPPAVAVVGNQASLGPPATTNIVTAVAVLLLLLACTWLNLATALIGIDVLRAGHAHRRRLLAPVPWQRAVAALLGAGALYLPQAAVADGPDGARDRSGQTVGVLDGLPLPDRPHGTGSRVKDPPVSGYRVRPGDCLWTVARTHLLPGTGERRIAAEWPRWYAANADVIGDDPDLLLPGTVLRAPETSKRQRPHRRAGSDPVTSDGGRP
jgi:nucleoid-associated protein YgaU